MLTTDITLHIILTVLTDAVISKWSFIYHTNCGDKFSKKIVSCFCKKYHKSAIYSRVLVCSLNTTVFLHKYVICIKMFWGDKVCTIFCSTYKNVWDSEPKIQTLILYVVTLSCLPLRSKDRDIIHLLFQRTFHCHFCSCKDRWYDTLQSCSLMDWYI